MASSILSVRIEDNDRELITEFAKVFGMSPSELLRTSALERIEDELDLKAYEEAIKEYEADPVSYSSEEIEKKYL